MTTTPAKAQRSACRASADPSLYPSQADRSTRHEYNNLVTTLVGPDQVAFTVHEHFICAKSKFFKNACSEKWTGGGTGNTNRVIRLADAEPRIFKCYLKWVYTNEIVIEIEDDPRDPNRQWRRPKEQDRLIKLYVLGNTLDDVRLRNRVLKDLINIDTRPFARSVTWAYEHTASTSNLRSVLVQLAVYRWHRNTFLNHTPDYHHEFLRDLVNLFMLTTKNNLLPHPIKLLPANLEGESNA
jgi:hypothetical protein